MPRGKSFTFYRHCKHCDKRFNPETKKTVICPECYEEIIRRPKR